MKPVAPVFMACVEITDGCWLWTRAKTRDGYGFLKWGRRSNQYAHRVAFELFVRPIPDGLQVRHRCDTPACVNPAHLMLGTHAQNMADRRTRKRAQRPSRHLTPEDVAAVRNLLSGGVTHEVIAARYGVTAPAISAIKRRRAWARA